MPTVKPDCGCCGKDFQFSAVKHATGTLYNVSFDGCGVQPLLWQVREKDGCQTVWKQGTETCVSGPVQCQIDLADVPNGVYEIVGNSPNCNGNGLAFKFIIGDVDEETSTPLTAPVLSALGINANTIRLTWTHAGAEDFLTQYSIDGEAWANIDNGIFDGALRTADTTPWVASTLYFFRMQARLSDGTASNFSNVVTAVPEAGGCEETLDNDTKNAFDSFAETNNSSYGGNFTGMLYRNNTVWFKQIGGFGANTPIHVASLSKQFAAALLLILVEEDVFEDGLDTTVGSLISSMQSAGKGAIKLRHLMSHTSGMKAVSTQGYEDQSGLTSAEAVDLIAANVPLEHTPGSYYQYGGVHWCIAARMAEVATGQSWVQLCQSKLWGPLGMSNTSYWVDPFPPTSNPMIHAGLITSVSDFGKFMQMRLKKGVFEGETIMTEASVLSMETDQTGDAIEMAGSLETNPVYGFGVYPGDGVENFHYGATSCASWINRDKKYFGLIFTNVTNSSAATTKNDEFRTLVRAEMSSAPECGETPIPATPHSRKVLVHNAIEWDFINLTANNSKVAKVVDGGATHVTILLQWWDYEPHQDVYDFTKLDNAVAYFESYGLKSLIQIPYRFAYNGMLNNSPNAYISTGAAILFRSGNRALSNVEGAVGCKANPAYADRQVKLVARIFDHINNNALLKANAQECLFIDGASNETGFFTGSYAGNIDDGDFNNATNNDFQLFLQDKYHGNISELNTAWGRSFVTFHAIQVGDYQPTLYGGSYIGYSENQRTKDWFEYMCVSHKLFYRRILQAVKNPHSVDPTLSSTNTGIRVACYWTEPYTGQGIFWGSGIINMLSEFDIVFSSRGASDGSHVGGNHLISFAQAIDTMLGCFPAQECGQEMDSDVLFANGHRIGPSRLARCIYSRGAEWMIYVFYDEIADWDEDVYYSIEGDTVTFLQDSQLAVSTYVTGQNRTIPTPSQTLSFDLYDVLDNVFNPNNVVTDWVELVDPDAEGLSSVYVQISMDEILS